MLDSTTLKKLETEDLRPTKMEVIAFHSSIGGMDTFTFQYSVPDLAELRGHDERGVAVREDFDLDDDDPGNRPMDNTWVQRIAEGIYDRPDTPIQMITLAVPPKVEGKRAYDVETLGKVDGATSLVRFKLYAGVPAYIENGQHTLEAMVRVWDRVKNAEAGSREADVRSVLAKATAPVQIIIQGDRNEIQRMFVVAGQTRPISPALMVALDQSSYANRLGTQVARKARLFTDEEDRLVYLRSAAREESLYSTAHMRGFASAILIGFRDRTPIQRESLVVKALEKEAGPNGNVARALDNVVNEIVGLLDHAYAVMPGWKQLRRGRGAPGLSPKTFRSDYLHGTPAGLYVISGALGAARFAGLAPERVIDAMVGLEWRRGAYEERPDPELGTVRVHPFFEGMLVRNERMIAPDGQIVWITATAGGARTNYEAATLRVLQHIANSDPTFKGLIEDATLKHLGLRSGRKGRPRKVG
jgi:hypothetical protein